MAVFGIVMGPLAIAIGFVFWPLLKLAAIVILSGALWIFAGLEWQVARRVPHGGARIRILLRISSAALLPGMLLAAFYGLGETWDCRGLT